MVDKKVSDFYNNFSEFQKTIAYNERHFLMLDNLIGLGLASDSNVLELGCGIGIVSSLILRVVKTGRLTAIDISPRSIEIARERNRDKNASFIVGDIVEYEPAVAAYDFVTLFDVLEHVPVDSHANLFARVSSCMRQNAKLVVNIPNPEYLRYIHATHPERLQIIDQPLSIGALVSDTERHGFALRSLRTYDLWCRNESVFAWFEKAAPFAEIRTRPPRQTVLRRLQNKFRLYW